MMPDWTSLIKVSHLKSDFKSIDIFEISKVDLVNKILISGQNSSKNFAIFIYDRADEFGPLEQSDCSTGNGRPTKKYF